MTKRTKAEEIQNLIDIQKSCLTSEYMIGLYNGLVVAHMVITGTQNNSFESLDNIKKKQKRVRIKR